MEETTYRMMFDSINEFKDNANQVESEIKRYELNCDHNEIVPRTGGRRNRDMWVSKKTVSHFNLGMALELMLKLLVWLLTKGEKIPQGHNLTGLYNKLEESTQNLLKEYYEAAKGVAPADWTLIALRNTDSPEEGDGFPKKRNLNNLREALEYFDEDAKLYLKRYSYELVEKRQWRHYISDISVFVEFIRDVMDDIENCEGIFHPSD